VLIYFKHIYLAKHKTILIKDPSYLTESCTKGSPFLTQTREELPLLKDFSLDLKQQIVEKIKIEL
jgi:hypothetical protein